MTTIAIVGAGPGLGAAVARRFGTEGFTVAVMSRSQDRVDSLAGDLTTAGVAARGYAADIREPDAVTAALARAADDLIPGGVTPGHPTHDPDILADRLWTMHASRDTFRVFAEPVDL